jgi:hypothetical protein
MKEVVTFGISNLMKKFDITRPDTRPGISRESLPLADFLDGWTDGTTDRQTNGWSNGWMGVRDDWYPLWEA